MTPLVIPPPKKPREFTIIMTAGFVEHEHEWRQRQNTGGVQCKRLWGQIAFCPSRNSFIARWPDSPPYAYGTFSVEEQRIVEFIAAPKLPVEEFKAIENNMPAGTLALDLQTDDERHAARLCNMLGSLGPRIGIWTDGKWTRLGELLNGPPTMFNLGTIAIPKNQAVLVPWQDYCRRHAAGDFGLNGKYATAVPTPEQRWLLPLEKVALQNATAIDSFNGSVKSQFELPAHVGSQLAKEPWRPWPVVHCMTIIATKTLLWIAAPS
jgi:hypothetical protein